MYMYICTYIVGTCTVYTCNMYMCTVHVFTCKLDKQDLLFLYYITVHVHVKFRSLKLRNQRLHGDYM